MPLSGLVPLSGAAHLLSLVADGRVAAAVVPAGSPLLPALADLVAAGVPVLLPDPAPYDVELLRRVRAAGQDRDVAVVALLAERLRPWSRLATDRLQGQLPLQVTVRGWGRGPGAVAELVDLVRGWCGEVVAVAAAPAPLPADALPDGPPVDWALLTEHGPTVLAAHAGPLPQVRFSMADRRVVASPLDELAGRGLAPLAPAEQVCRAFSGAVRSGTAEFIDGVDIGPRWDRPAQVADLLPVARVLEALRTSAREQRWVELG